MKTALNNRITVTISQAKRIVEEILLQDGHHPIFLHSSPGIGKSALIRDLAHRMNCGFIDVRLSTMGEPSDLTGIPFIHNGEMKFSIPSWFPTDPNSKGILFFDELTNANITLQHASYRIILDRCLQQGLALPVGWKIVAAGNLSSDKTGAKDVVPALANRFTTHLTIRPSLDDFITYCIQKKLSEEIIGFLNFNGDALFRFDPTKNEMAFANPRSWEQASKILFMNFSEEELFVTLSGCVGEGTTSEFLAFRKYYVKLPSFKKIVKGELEYTVPTGDVGITTAIASSLIVNFVENLTNVNGITNLHKVLVQLPDEFIYLVYKSLKNACGGNNLDCIVKFTQEAFSRITSYELYDKRNK